MFPGTLVAQRAPAGKVSSITKDGVTWRFDAPVESGQFLNGDYYVVGPVTLTSISPEPEKAAPYLNGSALNLPTASGHSPFDSRLNDGDDQTFWFDASARVYAPLMLKAGDSLVSSISVKTPHVLPSPMRRGDKSISPVASFSILTVLAATPAAPPFRPSYCDREQQLVFESSLHRGLLPSLQRSKLAHAPPELAEYEAMFRRPWVDLSPFNLDAPAEYMPQYGAYLSSAVSYATLLLTLDFRARDKTNLTNYLVQYGIDLFGCVKAGHEWKPVGGHSSGRKAPIIFAGILLDNSDMKHVSEIYPDHFGEDMQTVYVSDIPGGYTVAWQGAKAIYGGHYGVLRSGQPVSSGAYGPYEQLQPKDWPGTLGESYRRCCTSMAWVGEGLAMRLMGAQAFWNHDAFFDYIDRWMTEDDTKINATMAAQNVFGVPDWARQRQTRDFFAGNVSTPDFVDDMWAAFRFPRR
jgi:hypothetical protein